MAVRQQQRRGTAAQWTAANPILSAAEIGFEIDTNKFKIGDGTNRWSTLTYFTADAAAALEGLIDGAPGLLDTLNELAAAIGDDANFVTTVTTGLAAKAPLASPTFTGTVAGITKSMVGLGSVDNTADTAKPVSTAQATAIATAKSGAETTAATALASHEADTTNIHGITDTALLATKSYADSKASDAQTAAAADATSKVAAEATARNTAIATAKSEAISAAGTAADTKVSTAVAALTKSSVGLGNVDNTSDVNKPVSTATQTALDAKLASATAASTYATITNVALKAPLSSPELTGNPTAPTQAVGNDSTKIATTAFVKAAIQDIASLNLVLDGGGV